MAIAKLKSFIDTSLKSVSTPLDRSAPLEPEVGIRIIHSPNNKTLTVTVLGARHLPQNFGLTRVNSYVVKVKFLPSKEKFETQSKNESWPQWNEDFVFHLRKENKSKFGKSKVTEETLDGSKFIVVNLDAILEDKPLIATDKKDAEKDKKDGKKDGKKDNKNKKEVETGVVREQRSFNCRLSQMFSKSTDKVVDSSPDRSKSFGKRRTVGTTTISLDDKNFNVKPHKPKHSSDVSTGDMWRPLKQLSSGIANDRKENKKGQVELSFCQEKSDKKDGGGGNLVLTLLRLRCSLQTMHEHENLKGQLYIKMSLVEGGRVTQFWKSDRFAPCISMRFTPELAKVTAENAYEGALKDVSFVVKFVSKTKVGKKINLGHFVIGPDAGGSYEEQWKQALANPGQQVVKWQNFE